MGIVYADVRLGNDARPELEEINVTAKLSSTFIRSLRATMPDGRVDKVKLK